MNNWCTLNEPGTWSRFPSPKNSVSGSCYAVQSQDAEAHYYPIFRHTDAPDETTLRHFPSSTAADNRSEFEYARHSRNRFRLPLQNRQCPRTNSLSLSLWSRYFPSRCFDRIDLRPRDKSHFRGYFHILRSIHMLIDTKDIFNFKKRTDFQYKYAYFFIRNGRAIFARIIFLFPFLQITRQIFPWLIYNRSLIVI